MFNLSDFDEGEISSREESRTSYGRFHLRIRKWKRKRGSAAKHHLWWFVHNCVAHPLIGILPVRETFAFHDYTSDRINLKEEVKGRSPVR